MNEKRDRTSSRTAGDIERKYGKRIVENEKKAKSQNVDLTFLKLKINEVNNQVEEINKICENLGLSIDKINVQLEESTKLSHIHNNKNLLDTLTEVDIENWNDKIDGSYHSLGNDIEINQVILGINDYNLILVLLENVNRYIPCYRYQSSYKGLNIIQQDENIKTEEISIDFENEKVISIECGYNILEIIGIF